MNPFRIARNDLQVGSCRLIGFRSSLLPITKRPKRDLIANRKFFLGESQCAAQGLYTRYPPHSLEVCLRQGLRIWVS